jgi:hypothetical protein
VFAPPLPSAFASKLDFVQNLIGAENVVIWEAKHFLHFQVLNPCRQIKAFHLHCTGERTYASQTISAGKQKIGTVDRHGISVPNNKFNCVV